MSKLAYASKANASDNLTAMMNKGTKAMNSKQSKRTFKLLDDPEPGINLIVDPDNRHIASLVIGTMGRWQLITADLMQCHLFDHKPSLADCIATLR